MRKILLLLGFLSISGTAIAAESLLAKQGEFQSDNCKLTIVLEKDPFYPRNSVRVELQQGYQNQVFHNAEKEIYKVTANDAKPWHSIWIYHERQRLYDYYNWLQLEWSDSGNKPRSLQAWKKQPFTGVVEHFSCEGFTRIR